jgi:CspA family cold shock protein
LPNANRFGDLRCSTLSWCRRTRISASNAALDRNSPIKAHQINLQRSLIGSEYQRRHIVQSINYLADDDAIDNRSGLQPDARGREMVELSSAHAVLSSLNEGQVIEYEIVENRGKQSAENLKVSR